MTVVTGRECQNFAGDPESHENGWPSFASPRLSSWANTIPQDFRRWRTNTPGSFRRRGYSESRAPATSATWRSPRRSRKRCATSSARSRPSSSGDRNTPSGPSRPSRTSRTDIRPWSTSLLTPRAVNGSFWISPRTTKPRRKPGRRSHRALDLVGELAEGAHGSARDLTAAGALVEGDTLGPLEGRPPLLQE